jgi:probable addiction module antidote protein
MGESRNRANDDIAAALNAALAAGDLDGFMGTLGNMARAHRMARVAHETGLGRESLYKSMRAGASPEFDTVLKVLNSLGFRLQVVPVPQPDQDKPPQITEAPARIYEGEWRLMDEAKVNRDLAIIGKQAFVSYFELLADFNLPDNEIAEVIASDLGCTYDNAMSWRVKPARTLIRAGQAKTALLIISQSKRLPPNITQKALDLATALPRR